MLFISKLMALFILISFEDRSVVLEHKNIRSLFLVLTMELQERTRPGLAWASDVGRAAGLEQLGLLCGMVVVVNCVC